jgi:hypothetical protein
MAGTEDVAEIEIEAPMPRGFFARLSNVYGSPGAAFEEIGNAPRVLVPIFILILIGFVAGFLLLQFLDKETLIASMLQQLSQRGGNQAQMDQIMPLMSVIVSVQVVVGLMLGGVINVLFIAGYGKLFSAITGAKNTFKALLSVGLYSTIAVYVIKYAALVLVAFLKRPFQADLVTLNFAVASNLNALISALVGEDTLPKYLMAFARYIDLFVIWLIALLAIGFSAVSRKLTTKTAAVWLTVAYLLVALIGAAFMALRT